MDIDKSELKTEQLPKSYKSDYLAVLLNEIDEENLSKEELFEKVEKILVDRVTSSSDVKSKSNKFHAENQFILGQFYFETKNYIKAFDVFDSIKDVYYPAKYQLGIILYDDLLDKDPNVEPSENPPQLTNIDTVAGFRHPNRQNWELGVSYMLNIAQMDATDDLNNPNKHSALIRQAQYNIGKAYFQGFGIKQSDEKAERWWLLAADDGSTQGSVSAMTALGFFYSRKSDPEYFDLDKAYYWHNEACGNGSLESQGALGAMHYFGLGCKKDKEAAYECLTDASERGNIFAMGLLCHYYYKNKFYNKAYDLSRKVSALRDVEKIGKETNLLKNFIAKGIAMACFIQGRLFDLGKAVNVDRELAQNFYKMSFYFDPDLCQLFQNHTTHELI